MEDLLKEFLIETNESLQQLDESLVSLEHNPEDQDLLGKIFRVMHTIKGTCGFLGLSRLEKVAHACENVLGKIRDKELSVDGDKISLILEVIDVIKHMVKYIEINSVEEPGDDAPLIARLNKAADPTQVGPQIAAEKPSTTAVEPAIAAVEPTITAVEPTITAVTTTNNEVSNVSIIEPVTTTQVATKSDLAPHAHAPANQTNQTIRVSVNVLEGIMQFVSELVLTRNQLQQLLRRNVTDINKFSASVQRLNHITTELQEKVMKTRMQPIDNAWAPYTRLVRDLSLELKKKVELCKIGGETELDRQLIESIKDPLTHMVRNAIDHGIEVPDVRKASGKSEQGTLTLKAYHQGGHIIIEVSDDGKGMDTKRIKEKIIEKNLASAQQVDSLTHEQILQYIFLPGFSTAEKITSVSGRGVGMDVVKTNLEKISGTVELRSEAGKGSSIIVKIPLTLAIMSILIIGVRGRKFGIPQINIIEMVRIGARSQYKIEHLNQDMVLRLRGQLLPLVPLSQILNIEYNEEDLYKKARYVVVCELSKHYFGIIVEEVFDTEEIVVKPVTPVLKSIDLYSGSTLLGDGAVIMILEMSSVLKTVNNAVSERKSIDHQNNSHEQSSLASFLIMRQFNNKRIAVPLELVSRLEKIDVKKIELSGNKKVVQYRDSFMHLVSPEDAEWPSSGYLQAAVFNDGDKTIGIVVAEIVDIVDQDIKVFTNNDNPASIGSIVIGEHSTDLVNVPLLFKEFFIEIEGLQAVSISNQRPKVLLIDDSAFFRKFIPPMLEKLGYEVTTVDRATKAIELLKGVKNFSIVVTDINMPDMSGVEFAQRCSKDQELMKVPIVGISSSVSEKVKYNYDSLGFSACISKTNHDELATTLAKLIRN